MQHRGVPLRSHVGTRAGCLMVVCHCEAVNDASIRRILDDPSMTVDDVVDQCGAGSKCGSCRESICAVLEAHRLEAGLVASYQ